jgi:hypothetical protein
VRLTQVCRPDGRAPVSGGIRRRAPSIIAASTDAGLLAALAIAAARAPLARLPLPVSELVLLVVGRRVSTAELKVRARVWLIRAILFVTARIVQTRYKRCPMMGAQFIDRRSSQASFLGCSASILHHVRLNKTFAPDHDTGKPGYRGEPGGTKILSHSAKLVVPSSSSSQGISTSSLCEATVSAAAGH